MAPVSSNDTTDGRPETHLPSKTSSATASTTTPPPRSSISSEDNPFVQFRRFADSQISSLLQSVIGLPSLFERPSPTARWIVIQRDGEGNEIYVNGDKVTMSQRRELEEGWRKQKEQETEERARAAEAVREEEMRKWGGNVDAAAGQAQAPQRTCLDKESNASKIHGGLLNWLGWDGRRKHEDKQEAITSWSGALTMPSIRMSICESDKSKPLDPFSGRISEAVSWLLSDEYSPVFLRGHIPTDVHHGGPSFYHALHHPHWPDFRAASLPDRFEDELRFRVPWCDAFEDLVSLQNNGHMVDRDEPTRTSSAQWLNDMIKRGSLGEIVSQSALGPQWSTEYARTVWPFTHSRHPQHLPPILAPPLDPIEEILVDGEDMETDPVLSAFEIIKQIANLEDPTGAFGQPQHWEGDIRSSLIQAVAKDLMKPGALDELRRLGFDSQVQVIDHLFGDSADWDSNHGFLMAPPDVVAAAMRAAAASEAEPSKTQSIANEPDQETTAKEKQNEQMTLEERNEGLLATARENTVSTLLAGHSSNVENADEPPSSTSSSLSSTSSWSRWSTQEENNDSVVSTMTTVERRTLPDGTMEMKRVLKKRFADGREESNESVERQMSPSSDSQAAVSKPLGSAPPAVARQDKQTQMDIKESPRSKGNGWFWRE